MPRSKAAPEVTKFPNEVHGEVILIGSEVLFFGEVVLEARRHEKMSNVEIVLEKVCSYVNIWAIAFMCTQ